MSESFLRSQGREFGQSLGRERLISPNLFSPYSILLTTHLNGMFPRFFAYNPISTIPDPMPTPNRYRKLTLTVHSAVFGDFGFDLDFGDGYGNPSVVQTSGPTDNRVIPAAITFVEFVSVSDTNCVMNVTSNFHQITQITMAMSDPSPQDFSAHKAFVYQQLSTLNDFSVQDIVGVGTRYRIGSGGSIIQLGVGEQPPSQEPNYFSSLPQGIAYPGHAEYLVHQVVGAPDIRIGNNLMFFNLPFCEMALLKTKIGTTSGTKWIARGIGGSFTSLGPPSVEVSCGAGTFPGGILEPPQSTTLTPSIIPIGSLNFTPNVSYKAFAFPGVPYTKAIYGNNAIAPTCVTGLPS